MTRPIPQTIRYLYTLLRGNRLQITLNTLYGVLLVGLDLAFVWATKLAIDVATHHTATPTLKQALILIAAVMGVRITLSLSSRWVGAILGVKAQNDMRLRLFARLLGSRYAELRAFHTGGLTNRMERDVSDVVAFITVSLPMLVTTCTQFIGAFFFLFFMDRTLAVIVVCVIPFFVLSSKLYVKRMRKLTHQSREQESRIQSIIQETLQHVLVVKTLRRVNLFLESLSQEQKALHRSILTRTRYSTISSGLLNIGFATGYFVTFAWGVAGLSEGSITYGAMLAFIQLVGQIQTPVRSLSRFVPIFITSFTAAERLMDLEEMPQEPQPAPNHPVCQLPPPISVELSHVTFRYTPTSRYIFKNFSYSFPAGSVTAVVGETGAGKTTLIRLLLSLATPLEGRITLTGKDDKTEDISPLSRGYFAYVPQGNTLLSGTIRSNLLLGKPDATSEELHDALETAAAEFVFQKKKGLETPCGEDGDGLSEGQAQRIAIARALLSNGSFFIFDEATSSLDEQTERTVLSRITRRYPHRTFIFITHRPEALKYATQRLALSK